ncbi:YoaK family protein [Nocardioides sp.]|uniref:YoaK family protein n=1 Tax=Nocardioides sp. TaxID=35761 RepID=UPI003515B4B9
MSAPAPSLSPSASLSSRFRAVPAGRMHLWLMLVLTFTTGIVDAVGYLGLDRVFTGNMTGNVVILGMALTGADDLPILGPVLALVGFMAGAALGGRVLRRATPGWSRITTVLFGLVAVVSLALTAVLLADETPVEPVALTVTALLGAAMGLQAAVARFLAVKDVTTVVVTSTITGLAADSRLGSGKAHADGGGSGRRFTAVVAILAGAAVGAALLQWHLGAGLGLAAALIAVTTLVGALHARAVRPGRTAPGAS